MIEEAGKKIRIMNVVGARPNFMKIAPLQKIMQNSTNWEPVLIHTGQHYDAVMSKIFFEDLELPKPTYHLGVGSGTHSEQTAAIMIKLEEVVHKTKPDLVLVVGDVNSTLSAALIAAKLSIPIVHIEAGLRSYDRTMPEEMNRMLTDAVSDFLFITEESAKINLINEGIQSDKIHFVGNVMIDSLLLFKTKADNSIILDKLHLKDSPFALLTLHRPSNVDLVENLTRILSAIKEIQKKITIVFPIHPRTKEMIFKFNLSSLLNEMKNFILIDPLGYLDFLKLMCHASFVLTDSGGIQEETTALSVPCLTLRENTERPSTVAIGTNVVVGMDSDRITQESDKILTGQGKKGSIPPLWDGRAAERIVGTLENRIFS